MKHSHVDDKIFEDLGFPMDKDEEGNKVRREAGINQESRQRVKILTHKHQADLCDAIANSIEAEKKRKRHKIERLGVGKDRSQ